MTELSSWLGKNKELWARVFDEIIAPNVEQEWTKRTEEHKKELKTKDDNQHHLFAHVNSEVIKNAHLEEENARLKKLLSKQHPDVQVSAEELEANTAKATISVDEYRHLTERYDELNKRYQDTTQKLKYLERKNVVVMQKNREMKESVRAWQEYCDRQFQKQKTKLEPKAANDELKISTSVQAYDTKPNLPANSRFNVVGTPQPITGQGHSSPTPTLLLTPMITTLQNPSLTLTGPEDSAIARDRLETCLPLDQVKAAELIRQDPLSLPEDDAYGGSISDSRSNDIALIGQPSSAKLCSSQTTEDETDQINTSIQTTTPTDDDDIPQFVSERSLKRKRMPSAYFGAHAENGPSDGTPARPIRVKEELFSSPPATPAIHELHRKETMDLDELGPNVILTPRRQLGRTYSIHSNATGTLRSQRSSSAPFKKSSIKDENPLIEKIHSFTTNAIEPADTRALSEPGNSLQDPASVLQPSDPNAVVRAREYALNKRIKREDVQSRDKFEFLSESSEIPPPIDENHHQRPPKLALEHYNQRIRATKKAQTLSKDAHLTPKITPTKTNTVAIPTPPSTSDCTTYTPSPRLVRHKIPISESNLDSRSGAITDRRPKWTMAPPSGPARKAPTTLLKEPKPLRSKPLAELHVQDFKPNPIFNQGYTHAFSETVRKRSDRRCLPGCTDPGCCGSAFRTLAVAAAPLTSSQEENLLVDYLGDAYSSFGLSQMSQVERGEIVLQARTRKMAKDHGKHRQAYEGRKTPPGFWRVGFPSTQSQEEDREKALEMEKDTIRDRYLESMRKEGRWIFRDE